ncbi:hypothetical protein OQA88_13244 [Cercophora sp. LCS_1]
MNRVRLAGIENSRPGYRDIAMPTAKTPQQENPRSYDRNNNTETIAAETTIPKLLPKTKRNDQDPHGGTSGVVKPSNPRNAQRTWSRTRPTLEQHRRTNVDTRARRISPMTTVEGSSTCEVEIGGKAAGAPIDIGAQGDYGCPPEFAERYNLEPKMKRKPSTVCDIEAEPMTFNHGTVDQETDHL